MSKYGPPPLTNYEKYLIDGTANYVENGFLIEKIEKLNVHEDTSDVEKNEVIGRLITYANDKLMDFKVRAAALTAIDRITAQFKDLEIKRIKELEETIENLGLF